jgi:hypothetical protein
LVDVRLGAVVRLVEGPEAVTAVGAVEAVAVPSVSVVPTVVPTVMAAAVVPTVVPAVVPTVESAVVVTVVVSGLPARIVAAATPAAKTPPKTHNNASRRRIGSQYHPAEGTSASPDHLRRHAAASPAGAARVGKKRDAAPDLAKALRCDLGGRPRQASPPLLIWLSYAALCCWRL